ncbi:hypothetical protein IFM89_010400 [Coptis chinensis]|uniref:Uncharacterized protein n=1 Tax=Coptis chinensis TaxID=261450 RepID=A0A835LDX1_9MAGN|nr:hypothetical protein IFM89_010400 [Coptis chinensis]
MKENLRELQLLPVPISHQLSAWKSDSSESLSLKAGGTSNKPSVNLQLSISLPPLQSSPNCSLAFPTSMYSYKEIDMSCVKALKWQAEEQIRLATAEREYAEQVREMTRREMELAQSELAQARIMWEKARGEVEKAERLKERATRQIGSTCMEITCQACWRRFSP